MTNQEAVNLLRNASNADQAVSCDYTKYRIAYSVARKIDQKYWSKYWQGRNPKDLYGKLKHFKAALDSCEQSLKTKNQYGGFGYQPHNVYGGFGVQRNTHNYPSQNYGDSNTLAKKFETLNLHRNQSSSLDRKIKEANKVLHNANTKDPQSFVVHYQEINEAYNTVLLNFDKAAQNWTPGPNNLKAKLDYIGKGLKDFAPKIRYQSPYEKLEPKRSRSSSRDFKEAIGIIVKADSRTNAQYCNNNRNEIEKAHDFLNQNCKEAEKYWQSKHGGLRQKLDAVKKYVLGHNAFLPQRNKGFSPNKFQTHYNNFVQTNGQMAHSTDDERKKLFNDTQRTSCNQYSAETKTLQKKAYLIKAPRNPNGKNFYQKTTTKVSNQDSIQCALQLKNNGFNPLVLDFANGQNPGGGASTGHGNVQEEQMVYASNLYQGLAYLKSQKQSDELYNTPFFLPLNGGAYLPDVTFFRDSTADYRFIAPEKISIFASAAIQYNWPRRFNHNVTGYHDAYDVKEYGKYNSHFAALKDKKIYWETMANKFRSMCDAAIANQHDALVLGAWGCGAFGNDLKELITMYKTVLAEYKGGFRHIEFAILDKKNGSNITEFQKAF